MDAATLSMVLFTVALSAHPVPPPREGSVLWVAADQSVALTAQGRSAQAFRDPLSGRFRVPDPAQVSAARREAALQRRPPRRSVVEEAVTGPAGGFRVDLGEGYQVELVMHRADGSVARVGCSAPEVPPTTGPADGSSATVPEKE